MIEFESISLRNFLSYGNNTTIVQLQRPGTTLIVGENLDSTTDGRGGNGVGKAQPLHCKVKTPTGWTTIGQCMVGDVVSTPSGNPATVTGVFPQGLRPTYKLTFVDGRTTEADEDHLWEVFSHRWDKSGIRGTRTLTTTQLIPLLEEWKQKSSRCSIFIPRIVPDNTQPRAELPISPYLLGSLLGDGGLSGNSVVFTSADTHSVEIINELLQDHNQHLVQCGSHTPNYDWRVVNDVKYSHNVKSIKRCLEALGLSGTTSSTKFIPPEYMASTNIDQRLELLQGLMDTDGTVGNTKSVSFSSTSKQLALDVQYLVRSIGGSASIFTRAPFYRNLHGQRIEGLSSFEVRIQVPNPRLLFTLPRKIEKLSMGDTQYANTGLRLDNIEYIGEMETQCIMIDSPDHLYITDDFIVTHNTSIINAIVFALYDKPISQDIPKDGLVNNINGRNLEVAVSFKVNKVSYKVERRRKGKGGAEVFLFVDGEDKTPDSTAKTNIEIVRILGMPFEMFVRIVVFSASQLSFLDLPVRHVTQANQTSFIEELFGLTTLSAKADALKLLIADVDRSIASEKARVALHEQELDRHNTQIDSTKRRILTWESQNETTIQQLENKLSLIGTVDVATQQTLLVTKLDIEKHIAGLLDANRKLEKELVSLTTTNNTLLTEIRELKSNRCPYCKQEYHDTQAKIDGAETIIAANMDRMDAIRDLTTTNSEDLTISYERLHDVKSQITVDNLEELIEINAESGNIKKRIAELKDEVNPHLDALDELMNMQLKAVDYATINELTVTQDHQKFLLKLLTKKDSFVRKDLLDANIPYLNARLQHYLSFLGLPHKVEFTLEMTAAISQFGKPLGFGNLSAGQRARVNVALSLAFRDVLQQLHQQVNICLFDEVLDIGLDSVGIVAAANLLKVISKEAGVSLFIISHKSEVENMFDSTITIQLSKGFSYIKEG